MTATTTFFGLGIWEFYPCLRGLKIILEQTWNNYGKKYWSWYKQKQKEPFWDNKNEKLLWKKVKNIGGKKSSVKFKLNDHDMEHYIND